MAMVLSCLRGYTTRSPGFIVLTKRHSSPVQTGSAPAFALLPYLAVTSSLSWSRVVYAVRSPMASQPSEMKLSDRKLTDGSSQWMPHMAGAGAALMLVLYRRHQDAVNRSDPCRSVRDWHVRTRLGS